MQRSTNQMSEKFHCYFCPNFCLIRVRVFLNEVKLRLESSIRLNWWGTRSFREHWDHSLVFQDSIKLLEGLIMYSYSKILPPPFQMDSWTKHLQVLSFCNSWKKFKVLLSFFLRYFDWYHMHLIMQI